MTSRTRLSHSERFMRWYVRATPAESDLHLEAIEFEHEYFKDLRLEDRHIRHRLFRMEVQGDDGEWHETEDNLADHLELSIGQWIFRYRRSREYHGLCDSKHRTIYIRPDLEPVALRATLLHELIHAYEGHLTPPLREWLTLYLYGRMVKRISVRRLRRYIDISTHSLVHNCAHGVLFLLKSLDLDLRFRWPPGTVFGYGRENYFSAKPSDEGGGK